MSTEALRANEQARLGRTVRPAATLNRFQLDGALWHITYRGTTIRMPDSKGLTARIHHAVDRIQHYHPDLAAHLRTAIRTGTACTYQPAQPVDWNL